MKLSKICICVPLVATYEKELNLELALVKKHKPDWVEWRVDFLSDPKDFPKLFLSLKEAIPTIPLLITWRTGWEGGKDISLNHYKEFLYSALNQPNIKYLDVEFYPSAPFRQELIALAKEKRVNILFSNHNFHRTPSQKELVARLIEMKAAGGQGGKLAMMPTTPQDVLTLLAATADMSQLYPDFPIITMSMGELGQVSRQSGHLFGSRLTFASLAKASAPGQMQIDILRQLASLAGW